MAWEKTSELAQKKQEVGAWGFSGQAWVKPTVILPWKQSGILAELGKPRGALGGEQSSWVR